MNTRLVPAPTETRGIADPAARRVAFALLERVAHGELVIEEAGAARRFGRVSGDHAPVHVAVRSPHAYALALRGSTGLARGYVDQLWDCDDPAALVHLLAANMGGLDRLRAPLHALSAPVRVARRATRLQTRTRSRRHIGAHYDLGIDLFSAMLDESMTYSCGVFPDDAASLADASRTKIDMVCTKLGLGPDHRLLEIGGGWGGLAIHAASRYGCRVTTTTISRDQLEVARERVARAGLTGRVEVLLEDYRDLRGRYDRVASIEMIEAVGRDHLDTYFATASRLLEPDGAMLLQAIVAPHELFEMWSSGGGFANTVIFPGGCLPSIEAMLASLARSTDMHVGHLEDITAHYVRTLRCWRERFVAHEAELAAGGYDARFRRMWTFYLAYCEGAFAARRIGDVQVLLAKPRHRAVCVPVRPPYPRWAC
ncbi:MAG TPA: cyclopropane-fatty-acyl-phospholipid synthase family protein [Candidatus Dormibacteraeota bacterium]